MTKSQLETGMVCKHADDGLSSIMLNMPYYNGYRDVVVFHRSSWAGIEEFNEDLTWGDNETPHQKSLAIVEIYIPKLPCYALSREVDDIEKFELLWEREKVEEMTMAQICHQLGKKIKIVS